jgi:2-C-methyl-D-erythritol 4-phosphate cytidylyltransferase/2-C-methyl-D-erythritol 2,4-cyclodiphosphate synthase
MLEKATDTSGKTIAIIPAAGFGTRMGGQRPKQFLSIWGVPLLARTLLLVQDAPQVEAMVVVVPPGQEAMVQEEYITPYGISKCARVVAGGKERQDSVMNGLAAALQLGAGHVLIHDAARPLAPAGLFGDVLRFARKFGAAIAAMPCYDTVKQAGSGDAVEATLDRSRLWLIQTPQGFEARGLMQAMRRARDEGYYATDEAGLMERYGHKVALVKGARQNLKITEPDDLRMAEGWLMAGLGLPKVGQGMDVHRLVPDRPLILGGVRIKHGLGLLGHSDADVLTHAVMDALLSAAGLGDIGHWFPDDDPAYKGADSLALLKKVVTTLAEKGLRPAQVSVTLMAQQPKIAPHVITMRQNLARCLGLSAEKVNVAATTTEKLGYIGRGEGMAAQATAVLTSLIP